jgi:hypothetical protein
MDMMRTLSAAALAVTLLALAAPSGAADPAADTMPLPLAREVVNKTIELVESKGVYPRSQVEYDQAKAALLAVLDNSAGQADRTQVHARIRTLLATLDADGHSFLSTPVQIQQRQSANMARNALRPPAFRLVTTSRGTVLRWTPPPVAGVGQQIIGVNVKRFYDEADARPDIKEACALVVDLSEQTGGNAWPPFIAMYPLFGDANKANQVDRDGKRTPLVDRAGLERTAHAYGGGRANPLLPYASGPLAVVVGSRTSSAGEMLLVALLGEARVRTFGQTSQGLSTSNASYSLPDGATLVLTTKRYALGDGLVYRGGIPAMHPSEKGEPADAAVRTAAEWAAAQSPACAAAPKAAVPDRT